MIEPDSYQIDNSLRDLQRSPVFSSLIVRDFSKFVKYINLKTFEPEEKIFQETNPANNVYFIQSGGVKLISTNQTIEVYPKNFIGEEAAINISNYLSDAVATSTTSVWEIPKEAIQQVFHLSPQQQTKFYSLFINRFTGIKINSIQAEQATLIQNDSPAKQVIGWLLAIIIPGLVFLVTYQAVFD